MVLKAHHLCDIHRGKSTSGCSPLGEESLPAMWMSLGKESLSAMWMSPLRGRIATSDVGLPFRGRIAISDVGVPFRGRIAISDSGVKKRTDHF